MVETQQQALMKAAKFTDADRAANRGGVLSEAQRLNVPRWAREMRVASLTAWGVFATILLALTLAACRPSAVATVNGAAIPASDYRDRLIFDLDLRSEGRGLASLDMDASAFGELVLDTLIDEEIVRQRAAEANLTASTSEIEAHVEGEMGQTLQELAESMAASTDLTAERARALWVRQIGGVILLDKLIALQGFAPEEGVPGVHAAHILVATRAEADDLVERLADGEDFAALAAAHSLDSESAPKGGDLGWITAGMVNPEYEQVLFGLEDGQFGLVQTQLGWHVLTVIERGNRPIPAEQQQAERDALFAELLKQWRDEAKIVIDPSWVLYADDLEDQ